MNLIAWLFGFQSKLQSESDRLVAGIGRMADIFHEAADRLEGKVGPQNVLPAPETREVVKSKRSK